MLISGGTGVVTVAQLEDGRWARGYVSYFQPNSSWNLRLANGDYMNGNVISEEEAMAALGTPSSLAAESESESGTTSHPGPEEPGPGPDPDPNPNPDPDPDPDPNPNPNPNPDPGSGCGVDYEC